MKVSVEQKTLDDIILIELKKYNFSMAMVETYMYKDVVKKIISLLINSSGDNDILNLRRDVLTSSSKFYCELAEADNEMDVNLFHSSINAAYLRTLITNIKANNKYNYMEFAFSLGYLLFTRLDKKFFIKETVMIKKLEKNNKKKIKIKNI